jgi:hypothetical protein
MPAFFRTVCEPLKQGRRSTVHPHRNSSPPRIDIRARHLEASPRAPGNRRLATFPPASSPRVSRALLLKFLRAIFFRNYSDPLRISPRAHAALLLEFHPRGSPGAFSPEPPLRSTKFLPAPARIIASGFWPRPSPSLRHVPPRAFLQLLPELSRRAPRSSSQAFPPSACHAAPVSGSRLLLAVMSSHRSPRDF